MLAHESIETLVEVVGLPPHRSFRIAQGAAVLASFGAFLVRHQTMAVPRCWVGGFLREAAGGHDCCRDRPADQPGPSGSPGSAPAACVGEVLAGRDGAVADGLGDGLLRA